jgi:formylglycine-generating enzyme required for sulfatase activity
LIPYFASVLAALVLAAIGPPQALALNYRFSVFNVPGYTSKTVAYSINDNGQIVGSVSNIPLQPGIETVEEAFRFDGSTYTILNVPDQPTASEYDGQEANGINLAGEIVGSTFLVSKIGFGGSCCYEGFLKDGATYTTINFPGTSGETTAAGINNAGQVVGAVSYLSPVVGSYGFLEEGSVYTMIMVPNSAGTQANGINNHGQIVGSFNPSGGGSQGFVNSGGTYTTFNILGYVDTFASGINDAGTVVGSVSNAGPTLHGFVRYATGYAILDVPGAIGTAAYGINNHGQIVGSFNGGGGFVATPEGQLQFIPVAYLDNAADNPANCFGSNCGSVQYSYAITQYLITNTQYAAFLNAKAASDALGLYNASMGTDPTNGGITQSGSSGGFTYTVNTGFENKPIAYVSFYSAVRLANWMNNGQGSGDTESGSYTLLGGTPVPSNAATITRNPGGTIFLPSENEWYKAAYYSPGGTYFAYPFGTNTSTTCATPPGASNTANCNGLVGQVTDVGFYTGAQSPFGTYDQGGDVTEWTDTAVSGNTAVRGGDWNDPAANLASSFLQSLPPTTVTSTVGFRLVRVPAESSCGLGFEPLLVLPALAWLRGRRERKRE